MTEIITHENICIININNKPHNYLIEPEFVNRDKLAATINKYNCKAIIIRGAGKHFSAGADPENLKKIIRNESISNKIEEGKKLFSYLKSLNFPLISCVEGVCFGGGLEIVLNSDIKIASKKSLFAFPETSLNIIPGLGGTINLSGNTGKSKALELILRGNMFDAREAKDFGIIDTIVEPETSFIKGLKIAKSMISRRSVEVIKAVVELVRNSDKLEYSQALKRETELFCDLAGKALENNEL